VNAFLHGHQPAPDDAVVLLHVGARHMTMALVCGSALVYARDAVIARDWRSSEDDSLPERVMRELDRHWEILCDLAEPASLQWVCLSGGPARTRELGEELRARLGMRVEEIDPFRHITYSPGSDPGRVVKEHGPALSVAVGLALRSFDGL
jgi:Tfp pilus assembly PilM family ATPase